MRAVVFAGPGQFALTEVADPRPGPREVLVKVAAVGICGTDIHVLDGEFEPTVYPIIPGHETSGVVQAVGDRVNEVAPGDRVSVDPTLTCGECRFCQEGRSNLCLDWNGSGVARANGSTAELTLAPVRNVHRLPPGVDLFAAALIEPLSCAIRGYDRLPRRLGEHYLIYGAGTMGLMMAQLAPRAGACSVSVVDTNEQRLVAAAELGLTRLAAVADDLPSAGAPAAGYDVVIDCTGALPAIEDGLDRVRRGGTFLQFGVAATDARSGFSPFRVYHDELSILGSMAVLHSYARAVDLFAAGVLNADKMISHAFSLAEYGAAIEMFRTGGGRKLQIRPWEARSVELLGQHEEPS